MNFVLLSKQSVDTVDFINFWSDYYSDKYDDKYSKNIDKEYFNRENLISLYEWKNGSVLAELKKIALQKKILLKIKIINSLKNQFNLELFKKEFKDVSVIWKIFLLHIIKPSTYPIFDQHVFRAMMYIKFSKIEEIPSKDSEKEKIYFEEYVDFFNGIKSKLPSNLNKKIDESLWAFGKFLKSNYSGNGVSHHSFTKNTIH